VEQESSPTDIERPSVLSKPLPAAAGRTVARGEKKDAGSPSKKNDLAGAVGQIGITGQELRGLYATAGHRRRAC
jgi:hypothetical protein